MFRGSWSRNRGPGIAAHHGCPLYDFRRWLRLYLDSACLCFSPALGPLASSRLRPAVAHFSKPRWLPSALRLRDWHEAMDALLGLGAEHPVPVVIDEFPYLVKANPALPSAAGAPPLVVSSALFSALSAATVLITASTHLADSSYQRWRKSVTEDSVAPYNPAKRASNLCTGRRRRIIWERWSKPVRKW